MLQAYFKRETTDGAVILGLENGQMVQVQKLKQERGRQIKLSPHSLELVEKPARKTVLMLAQNMLALQATCGWL